MLRDPSHREWNDVKNALKSTGLWGTILETTLCFNAAYGPWDSAAWWKAAREASLQYIGVAAHARGDPLLEFLQPLIAADRSQDAVLLPAGAGRLEAQDFASKGPKVSLTRWFGWMDAAAWHLPRWHSHLAVLLYMGVQLGHLPSAAELPLLGGSLLPSKETMAAATGQQVEPAAADGAHDGQEMEVPVEEPTAVDSVRNLRARCLALKDPGSCAWHLPFKSCMHQVHSDQTCRGKHMAQLHSCL